MAYRIIFRFERSDYSEAARADIDREVKVALQQKLDQKSIKASRIFPPGRNSIKVLFLSETELNKVLDNEGHFSAAHLKPRISISLKASRTVFCGGFDPILLENNSKENIHAILEPNWKVKEIYIMRSGRSFKIEFRTQEQANKFINTETNIDGIMLKPEHKELEVDPTIDQCWVCGRINPRHGSGECSNTHRCLRCGGRDHRFFNCDLPRHVDDMNERQRDKRYCIPCGTQGNHTSLDHSACPTKREIIRGRTLEARAKRNQDAQKDKRDFALITKAFDFTNNEAWPGLRHNPDQTKVSTIVTLALLDEAVNPGTFQEKLAKSCKLNNIPTVKYTLEPNTATAFYNTLCGAATHTPVTKRHLPQSTLLGSSHGGQPKSGKDKHIISVDTRHYNQRLYTPTGLAATGGKRDLTFNETNSMELTSRVFDTNEEKRQRTKSPHITQTHENTPETSVTGGETYSTDTIWRLNKLRDMLENENLIMDSLIGEKMTGAKKTGSVVEKKITMKALSELLDAVQLRNGREWVGLLREHLEHLIGKGLGEHLLPFKAETKTTGEDSQQKPFFR